MAGAFRNLAQSVLIAVLKSVVMMLLACLATWFLNEGSSRIGTSVSGMLKHNTLASCTLSPSDITDGFGDVGGLDEIKNDLYSSVVLPLRHADVFYTHHLRHLTPPRGVLFSGPPGTGKSMLARALAKECGVPLIAPTPSMIENKYYGESTKMVANMFQTARALQPCILFVDEIDGMMRNRSEDDQACVYSVKTEFINQMDGTLASAGDRFVVIGATNLARTLDPALARRMRKVYEFGPPGVDQRRQIISLCKEAADLSEHDVNAVAEMTHGMTGSDVREVIKCASGLRMHRCASDSEFMACVQRSDASAARNYVCALTRADWSRAVEWIRSSMRSRDDPPSLPPGRLAALSALQQLMSSPPPGPADGPATRHAPPTAPMPPAQTMKRESPPPPFPPPCLEQSTPESEDDSCPAPAAGAADETTACLAGLEWERDLEEPPPEPFDGSEERVFVASASPTAPSHPHPPALSEAFTVVDALDRDVM